MLTKELIAYVLQHPKRDKAFPEWTKEQLCYEIYKASLDFRVSWSEASGKPTGLVLIKRDDANKVLRVIGILADNDETMLGFLVKYCKWYRGWTVIGRRHGKDRVYDERFLHRVWKRKL